MSIATLTDNNRYRYRLRKKKILWIFFFLFLCSCQKGPCPVWECDVVTSSCPRVHYGRLLYAPPKCLALIKPEITHASDGIRLYFNLCLCPLEESGEISFQFSYADCEETGSGHVLEGGQRVLVDPESARKIITALYDQKCVKIEIGFYDATVEPIGFVPLYRKLIPSR